MMSSTVITTGKRCICNTPNPYRSYLKVEDVIDGNIHAVPGYRCMACTDWYSAPECKAYIHFGDLDSLRRKMEAARSGET
jgi:hypothetical protein